MTHIRAVIEQAERWLEELWIEEDRVSRLLVQLRAAEKDAALLLPRRPRRNLQAVLRGVKRELRKAG